MLADHKTRVSELLAKAKDKKQAADALGELAQLAAKAELESVLVTALPQVIEAIGDKQKTTQAAATAKSPRTEVHCSACRFLASEIRNRTGVQSSTQLVWSSHSTLVAIQYSIGILFWHLRS